jgi:hypothetical protein
VINCRTSPWNKVAQAGHRFSLVAHPTRVWMAGFAAEGLGWLLRFTAKQGVDVLLFAQIFDRTSSVTTHDMKRCCSRTLLRHRPEAPARHRQSCGYNRELCPIQNSSRIAFQGIRCAIWEMPAAPCRQGTTPKKQARFHDAGHLPFLWSLQMTAFEDGLIGLDSLPE